MTVGNTGYFPNTEWTVGVPREPKDAAMTIPEQAVEAAALVMARKKYGHMSSLLSLPISARNAMLQNAREILIAAQPLMGVEQIVAQCAACVPTTWLDPLLSGPKKVADFKDGPAVERLLQAIRSRILAIVAEKRPEVKL